MKIQLDAQEWNSKSVAHPLQDKSISGESQSHSQSIAMDDFFCPGRFSLISFIRLDIKD
jgi:hypothetical protein